jgi:hypothetical protein
MEGYCRLFSVSSKNWAYQLSSRFGELLVNKKIQLCPREANKVAHNLARFSYDSDGVILWDGDPPISVLNDVMKDISLGFE